MTLEQLKNMLKEAQTNLENAVKEGDFKNVTAFTNKAEELMENIVSLQNAEKIKNKVNGMVINPAIPVSTLPAEKEIENKVVEFFNVVKTARTNPMEFANVMASSGNEMVMPEDLVKEIRAKRIADGSLEDLISWENPTAKSGSRTLELDGEDEGLIDLDENEGEDISDVNGPKFKAVKFDKKTKAGIIRVSNSLLEDSVGSLKQFIVKTLAMKGKKSLRAKILEVLNTFTTVEADSLDDLKEVIEVELDPAYLEGASIVLGQKAFNHLSSMKDSDGKYILEADVTKPGQKVLFGLPVKVVSKKVIKDGKIYVGNFKEGVLGFGDVDMKLAISDQAGFTKNQTIFRAIERFDVVKGFEDAVYVVNFTLE